MRNDLCSKILEMAGIFIPRSFNHSRIDFAGPNTKMFIDQGFIDQGIISPQGTSSQAKNIALIGYLSTA